MSCHSPRATKSGKGKIQEKCRARAVHSLLHITSVALHFVRRNSTASFTVANRSALSSPQSATPPVVSPRRDEPHCKNLFQIGRCVHGLTLLAWHYLNGSLLAMTFGGVTR